MEQLQENQEKMIEQIDMLKKKMKGTTHRLEKMLVSLCKAQRVDYAEDDVAGDKKKFKHVGTSTNELDPVTTN